MVVCAMAVNYPEPSGNREKPGSGAHNYSSTNP